jgi:predicted acyltransferase
VLRRSALLFALGLLYYGGVSSPWPDIRLTGVLNRIAVCYLLASLLFLNLRPRALLAAAVAVLVGYWGLMTFVPVPGIGAGSFEKGANLANWIDAQYLPGLKLEGDWDPEGLLSTLPAVGTCLLGVLAGLLLRDSRLTPSAKSAWLIGAGVLMIAGGLLWGVQFPVVKKIWTSSFVLVAGGFSALLLGAFHHLADVWGRTRWAVAFMWIGANALTLYLAANIVDFQSLARRLLGGDVARFLDAHVAYGAGRFAAALLGLALAVALARFLYRRKIFLRI